MGLKELKQAFLFDKLPSVKAPDYSHYMCCSRCGSPVGRKGDAPAIKVDGRLQHSSCKAGAK